MTRSRRWFISMLSFTFAIAVGMGAFAQNYSEAPMLTDMVEAGQLPPIEERLPLEPLVVEVVNEIGQYGGTYRGFQLGDGDRWVVSKTALYGGLVARTFRDLPEISLTGMTGWGPALATSWEWNEDATEITIHLREGARWSDGAPITADDMLFAWNDVQANTEYQPTVSAVYITDGEPLQIHKIDDYTVRFEFNGPNPWFLNTLYNQTLLNSGGLIAPKHYLEQFHPGYNPSASWEDFQQEFAHINPNLPSHGPWMLVSYNPAEAAVLERNPFYWKVDSEGNQLPYIDRMVFTMMGNQEVAVLRGMAGELDVVERNFQVLENVPLLRQNEAAGNYTVQLWTGDNFTMGNEVWFNYDLIDPQYAQLRDLLRTPQFRNALSVAIDRESINQLLYLGLARPANLGLSSASPYWDEEMESISQLNADYNPDQARQWLEELGLRDINGDGFVQYPDGERVILLLGAAAEITAHVSFGELVVDDWQAIGLDARLDVSARNLLFTRINNREFHTVVWGTTDVTFPQFRLGEGPIMPGYQTRDHVEDAPEDLEQLWQLVDDILRTVDDAEAEALMKEHQRLRAENNLGIWAAADVPVIALVHNRMGNIPSDIVFDNQDHLIMMPDQWFIRQ